MSTEAQNDMRDSEEEEARPRISNQERELSEDQLERVAGGLARSGAATAMKVQDIKPSGKGLKLGGTLTGK